MEPKTENQAEQVQWAFGGGTYSVCPPPRVPQLANITKNSETNHTYSSNHTLLTYKILSSNSLYFRVVKKINV
jgi:hypothetical protein